MKKSLILAVIAVVLLTGFGCSRNVATSPVTTPPTVTPLSRRLDMSGTGLDRVPLSMFERTDLEELDLSNNRLTGALPAEIRHLRNLRILDASDNSMTGVPAEIGQLSALRELDLSNNKLTGLPLELGNLKGLRRLDLRGNAPARQDLDAIRAQLSETEILE